jgi:magnesium chelatase family protein
MVSKLFSGTVVGLQGMIIAVEVDVAYRGFPTFTIVGLPNKAVDEAKDRVRTSIINTKLDMPDARITVNLAPADLPKIGSGFDLPIALGILAANKSIILKETNCLFIGELSLEGHIRTVPGILPIIAAAREKGITTFFIPKGNASEVGFFEDVRIYAVNTLTELINHLNNKEPLEAISYRQFVPTQNGSCEFDFSEIKGQDQAKRVMQIAAAGSHNLHFRGPPGAGKTMLCKAFPSILPSMTKEEIFEVSQIYSACGLLTKQMIIDRPFRAPHHTISRTGLIGGGSIPKPGEISLAHRGVLFLDELPEFSRSILESMRQPLEDGVVTISRISSSLSFPARFVFLSTSNPCPCGYFGSLHKKCICTEGAINAYQDKISGPLLDRIDLFIEVAPVNEEQLTSQQTCISSNVFREQVMEAREQQLKRFKGHHLFSNSEMKGDDIKKFCKLSSGAEKMLKDGITSFHLSARSYFKIIKIAQTIADLSKNDHIEADFIAEALQYRKQD